MHSLHDYKDHGSILLEQVVKVFALGCLNACLGGRGGLGSIMQGNVLVRNDLFNEWLYASGRAKLAKLLLQMTR